MWVESDQGLTIPCAREWLQDEDSDDEKKAPEEFLVKGYGGNVMVEHSKPSRTGAQCCMHGSPCPQSTAKGARNPQEDHALPCQNS